ncbi:hypothetical protein [Campylobacter concisus]|nr:hypothetical protein [Campylobacter concisus]EIF07450.1 hypothetical protein UNSWCD_151 [Campylobacter concisus UNSWCD]
MQKQLDQIFKFICLKKFSQILKFMNEHITLLNLVANDYEP